MTHLTYNFHAIFPFYKVAGWNFGPLFLCEKVLTEKNIIKGLSNYLIIMNKGIKYIYIYIYNYLLYFIIFCVWINCNTSYQRLNN